MTPYGWRVLRSGEELSAYSFDVKFDEGDFAWSGSIHLGDYGDYETIKKDDEILIQIGEEEYRFIVDGKVRNLGQPAELQLEIQLVSPTAIYEEPRSERISTTWEEAVLASVAAQEYIGQPLLWQILDWEIPAFRLGVEDTSPIKIVSLLATAVKAMVETTREGELYVRPAYKHTTEFFYEDVTPDHVIDDGIDVFAVRDNYSVVRLSNLFRIRDVEVSYADSIEWRKDEGSTTDGELRAFPSPYRSFEAAPLICTTETPTVALVPVSEVEYTIEEPELLEIFDGRATTQYPIYEIVSVEWESEPLPNLVFDAGTKDIRVVGASFPYGLARVVYKTRYHSYRVSGTVDRAAQFLMLDES